MTAADALGDIHDNIIDMMAMVNSGNNPISSIQKGQPVPGIPGAEFRDSNFKSANTKKRKRDLDYEIRATGKGQQNRPWAVQATKDNDTEFDWYDGTLLIDAKNYEADNPLHPSVTASKPQLLKDNMEKSILDSADRQLQAISKSNATGIEWRIPTKEMVLEVERVLQSQNLLFDPRKPAQRKSSIVVKHYP